MKNITAYLGQRYPGLYLPVEEGMSKTQLYKGLVLAGKLPDHPQQTDFVGSDQDEIRKVNTPAGEVEVIYLEERMDFQRFLQKLAYKCEPVKIRDDVGAMMISGVINWEKIRNHKNAYFQAGNLDWKEEFKRFTSRGENYKDRVLVISSGPYSNIPAETAGFTPEEWKDYSIQIRIYHECTHYVCRNFYPEKKDALADEVIADSIGVLGAFGHLEEDLCRLFLGISKEGTYVGGRMSAYVAPEDLDREAERGNEILHQIQKLYKEADNSTKEPFDFLDVIMKSGKI